MRSFLDFLGRLRMPFDGALRGIGGEYEITRVLGGFGALAYCASVILFVGWEVIWLGKPFDLVAYCTAFPGGLVFIIGVAAGSASIKDRNVASARVTERTGAIPAAPPAGPEVPTLPMDEAVPTARGE